MSPFRQWEFDCCRVKFLADTTREPVGRSVTSPFPEFVMIRLVHATFCATRFPIYILLIAGYSLASAQVAPSLGQASDFSVLGGSTVTNTGPTVVLGNLGLSPGSSVTGFPPGTVTGGSIHISDAIAQGAQDDTTAAYISLAGQAANVDLTGQDLGGLTLTSGVYSYSTSAQLTGTLTLDAEGNSGAVFIFQIGSSLTTASTASVEVINGGGTCNVFWQVGSSATLGTATNLVGNVIALSDITLNTGANVAGRVLARNGAVTLDSSTFTNCSGGDGGPGPPGPQGTGATALPAASIWSLLLLGALLVLGATVAMGMAKFR